MLDDAIRPSGQVTFTIIDGDLSTEELSALVAGEVSTALNRRILSCYVQRNLITNTGRGQMTSRIISGGSITIPGWIAITQTAITPAATDTTLASETFRKACSTVVVLSTYTQRYVMNSATTDWNGTCRGIGLFTASSAGNMWAIASANVAKSASQSLVTDWRILTAS